MRTLRVALLGCGGVGSEVFRLLQRQADDLAARIGAPLEVIGVAVRRPGRARAVPVPQELLTSDAMDLVTRPETDIVVEVIGGIEPVRSLLLAAMKNGKSVVSANKALLAEDGATLHQAARENGADLYYEAAVAARSRCCARCASRWPATGCAACSASSTAPPTTSSPG